MYEIKEMINSPGWWFSTVFVAVVVSVVSNWVSKKIDQIRGFDEIYHFLHWSYVVIAIGIAVYAGIYTDIASNFAVSNTELGSTIIFILGTACLNFGIYILNFGVPYQKAYRIAIVILIFSTMFCCLILTYDTSARVATETFMTLNLFGVLIMLLFIVISKLLYFMTEAISSNRQGSHHG